ncbi:MAG: alpha/beta hydrolase [Pseudomonadota bacterium]|nr:alpha/beta hydrolase [Pseudomonadota bacterium]|tara:strand:+ start:16046 stop:16885 length:840 start_codon:yes stop_codon:yes gene_type:complete
MKFEGKDGLNIIADSWGSDSDPLVILLHGGGQTRHAWGESGELLSSSGFYVLALDLRGHGDSDWHPEGDYSIESHKEDLIKILDYLKKPASLVGASLGGIISLSLAGDELHSHLCNNLVMVDIGLYPDPEGATRIVDWMKSAQNGFDTLEEAAEAVAQYLPHRKRPRDIRGLKKNLRKKKDGRFYWHWDPRFLDRRTENPNPNLEEIQRNAARRVKVPTLLIRGALSDVVTDRNVKEFLSAVPHAEFEEINQAAHMVAGDRNDVFVKAAVNFLKNNISG